MAGETNPGATALTKFEDEEREVLEKNIHAVFEDGPEEAQMKYPGQKKAIYRLGAKLGNTWQLDMLEKLEEATRQGLVDFARRFGYTIDPKKGE